MKSLSLKTNLSFANNDTLCHHLSSKQSNLALWQSNIRFIVWSGALLQWTKYHLLKSSGGLPTLSLKSSCCPKAKLISFLSIEAKNNPNQPYKISSLCGRLHRDLPCTFLSLSLSTWCLNYRWRTPENWVSILNFSFSPSLYPSCLSLSPLTQNELTPSSATSD